jgi:hypothetical protein
MEWSSFTCAISASSASVNLFWTDPDKVLTVPVPKFTKKSAS